MAIIQLFLNQKKEEEMIVKKITTLFNRIFIRLRNDGLPVFFL